jgi:hypothetical protein
VLLPSLVLALAALLSAQCVQNRIHKQTRDVTPANAAFTATQMNLLPMAVVEKVGVAPGGNNPIASGNLPSTVTVSKDWK